MQPQHSEGFVPNCRSFHPCSRCSVLELGRDSVGEGLVSSPWWLPSFYPKWWKTEAIVLRVFMHLVAFSHSNSLELWLSEAIPGLYFLTFPFPWGQLSIPTGSTFSCGTAAGGGYHPSIARVPHNNENQDGGFWIYRVILAALVTWTLNSVFQFLTCPSVTSPFMEKPLSWPAMRLHPWKYRCYLLQINIQSI